MRPPLEVPDTWQASPSNLFVPVGDLTDTSIAEWWRLFEEEDLDHLITTARIENYSIKAASHRVEAAFAQASIAQGGLLPQIFGGGSLDRRGTSAVARQTAGTFPRRTFSSFLVNTFASWEVDLWGRVRREVEALSAEADALGDIANDLRLSVEAEVANQYFLIRALDAQIETLVSTVELRQDTLELAEARFEAGETAALDVERAQSELSATRVTLLDRERQRAQAVNDLAQLLGMPASQFAFPLSPLKKYKIRLPDTVPASLVRQRPDVLASEQQVVASNARIGVATAAFFPQLSLSASFGTQAAREGDLFTAPSRVWSLGPGLTLPLFQGGSNVAGLNEAEARYREAVETYRAAVLNAFIEVENSLIALDKLQQQLAQQKDAVTSAKRARELSETRYRSGLVNYLEVLDTQRTELQEELTEAELTGRFYVAAVGLVRALGGSWAVQPIEKEFSKE